MCSRRVLVVGLALCGLAAGCSDSGLSSTPGDSSQVTADPSVPVSGSVVPTTLGLQPFVDLLPEVVATLHPGFEYVQFLVNDGNIFHVEARHTRVPELVVKVWYQANGNEFERSRTADVGGISWTTPDSIDQLTDQSTLIVGALQAQLLQSIVSDTGFVGGNNGRYVVILGVNSNVEVFARVLESDGTTITDYLYRLDMSASPAVFRYVG